MKKYLGDAPFMVTYGDGVANVEINKLVDFHTGHGKLMTLTGILPEGRFGVMDFGENSEVLAFREKSQTDTGWINGGFLVCNPGVLDYIDGDDTMLEREPMERLALEGKLACYKHNGFWQCMDTLRDKEKLERLWNGGSAPWKVWE